MGLGARWLVSFGLLVLPVAVTLGILFGLQARYEANGGKGSFTGPGDSGLTPNDNRLTYQQSCELATGLGEDKRWKGQEYILNPNQWKVLELDGESSLCMDIIWHNNGSYATKDTAPKFQATWQYDPENGVSVHAFPNAGLVGVFPKKINSVSEINVELEWTYALGNENKTSSDVDLTRNSDVQANVALDLFIDADAKTAAKSADARFEIMVWFAAMGTASQPNGDGTVIANLDVEGNTFDLYYGDNPTGQNVYTWIPRKAVENFKGDLYPLVEAVINYSGTEKTDSSDWASGSDYIGYLSMGTEAYFSPRNVTFYVPTFSVNVKDAA